MPDFLGPMFNGTISTNVGLFALVIVAIAALCGFRRGDWGKNFVSLVLTFGTLFLLFTLGLVAGQLGMVAIVILVVFAVFGLPKFKLPNYPKQGHRQVFYQNHRHQQQNYQQNKSRRAHPPAISRGSRPINLIGNLNNLSRKFKALGQPLSARGKEYDNRYDEEEWR